VLSTRGIPGASFGVAMNRRGDAIALWGERDNGRLRLVASRRRAGAGVWEAPSEVPLSSPTTGLYSYYGTSFALDEAGMATLVDQTSTGAVEVATLAAASDVWAGPTRLGDGGPGTAWYTRDSWCVRPRVALDSAGGAFVIWGGDALYSTRRRPGERNWETPVTVAPGPVCFQRALAVDAAGDAVAIWNPAERAADRLDAAIFDATPPVLSRLSVPRRVRAGLPARFSVVASDVWSSLSRAPLWRFGDGTQLRGATVRHRYRHPGLYRVTVVARDKAGNEARSSTSVRVNR
jgi:hypothetical protein